MREVILIGGSQDGAKVEVAQNVDAYLAPETMEQYLDAGSGCFEFEGILSEKLGADGPDFVVVMPSKNL